MRRLSGRDRGNGHGSSNGNARENESGSETDGPTAEWAKAPQSCCKRRTDRSPTNDAIGATADRSPDVICK